MARMWHGCGLVRQETAPPLACLAANPEDLTDFDVPVYVAGRLWCPRTGRFSGINQGRHSNHLRAVGR
jgi:hypothetical protein